MQDYYEPVQFSVLAAILKRARDLAGYPFSSVVVGWTITTTFTSLGLMRETSMPDRLAALAAGKKFTLFRIKEAFQGDDYSWERCSLLKVGHLAGGEPSWHDRPLKLSRALSA